MAKKKKKYTKREETSDVIKPVFIKEEKKPEPVIVKKEKSNFPISFTEYVEELDTYLSRALKVYANVQDVLAEKTKDEWDDLLTQMKMKPIT